jgi:hypothetical protein
MTTKRQKQRQRNGKSNSDGGADGRFTFPPIAKSAMDGALDVLGTVRKKDKGNGKSKSKGNDKSNGDPPFTIRP